MREIKFRGKPIGEIEKLIRVGIPCKNGWVYGNLITNNGKPFIVGEVVEADIDYIAHEWWVRVHPETVGQSTGLHDKNGKGIYEGDILKDEEHYRWEVTQIDGGWVIKCSDMPGMQCLTVTKTEGYEVIDNIHENPELLESGE